MAANGSSRMDISYVYSSSASYSFDITSVLNGGIDKKNEFYDLLLLGLLSFIGVLGNAGLLLSVCRSARLRTSANILLTNLATGDLLYILISAPFFVEHELHPNWQYGTTLCKLINAGEITAQGVCVLSLTALSIERYAVLVKGSAVRRLSRRYRGWLSIFAIWVLSLFIALPVFVLADTTDNRCDYLPVDEDVTKVYEVGRVLLLYVLPMFTIACFYTCIAKTLFSSAGQFARESQPGVRHFSARKRLAFTVLVIALFFGLFWMPYYLHVVLFRFNPYFVNHDSAEMFRRLYYFAALSNSCLNPWVVYVMSSTYRAILVGFLTCRKEISSSTTSLSRYPLDRMECKVVCESYTRRSYIQPKSSRVSEV
ncbi:Bombesin receptor subtype-3 [Holothuria leucospilota]|uniref:Bombesin receptor subtype-3 n=1 Tax=Holothuria leucospilota TaxID=206669 RepID=A0A9Q1C0D7_HOLLE|nr:Bombesin receptor subtype-3 [Holothuria leucospilota]